MTAPKRYLVVADTDSRLQWALQVGKLLTRHGYRGETILAQAKANPSAAQLRDLGLAAVPRREPAATICQLDYLGDFDAIVIGLMGPDLGRFLDRIRQQLEQLRPARRPLLISGYWGITGIRDAEGLLWRLGCDLICLNNAENLEAFTRILADCHRDADILVPTGFLAAGPTRPAADHGNDIRTVLFVGQPNLPRTRYAKAYLLHHLIDYARQHPDRSLVIKPRMRPGERATHREGFSLESLCRERKGGLPPNLSFGYGAIEPFLERADLILTISSAAAIEAWGRGKRAALVSDFGIDDTLANPFFIGSGAFASFAAILADQIPPVDPAWLTRKAFSPGFSGERLIERLAALADRQSRQGAALPMQPSFFTEQAHPLAFGKVDIRRYHRARALGVLGNILRRVKVYWNDRAEFFD